MFDLTRRGYLDRSSSIVAGNVLSSLPVITTTGESDSEGRAEQSGDLPAWERQAEERIREHRKTDLRVEVTDGNGNPVPSATVDVHMRRHGFDFGTAINAQYLLENATEGGKYRTNVQNLFNKAVLENRHKWAFWEQESERQLAIEATDWLLEHGLEMRGHTCIWQRQNQGAIPGDVVEATRTADQDLLERRTNQHISDIVGYYDGVGNFTEWDVANEPVQFHAMTNVLDPFAQDVRPPALADWYRRAAEADPDAQLFVNEYDIITGDDRCKRDRYERLIRFLRREEAGLGGIGMQAHHYSPDLRRSPEQLLSTLDRFAQFDVPIQITEFDTWGDGWTESMEAEYLYRFLKTVFSHPAVEGFLMWGIWDELHWKDNAPLFRADWSPKPAYHQYRRLVFDQWWTVETGRTDSNGVYETTGFLGEYDITARNGQRSETVSASLTNPAEPKVVSIQL